MYHTWMLIGKTFLFGQHWYKSVTINTRFRYFVTVRFLKAQAAKGYFSWFLVEEGTHARMLRVILWRRINCWGYYVSIILKTATTPAWYRNIGGDGRIIIPTSRHVHTTRRWQPSSERHADDHWTFLLHNHRQLSAGPSSSPTLPSP
jgi:hypothetical protein